MSVDNLWSKFLSFAEIQDVANSINHGIHGWLAKFWIKPGFRGFVKDFMIVFAV